MRDMTGEVTFPELEVAGLITPNVSNLGALGRSSYTNFLNGEIAHYMPYSRATSDAEDMRIHNHLRISLSRREISI